MEIPGFPPDQPRAAADHVRRQFSALRMKVLQSMKDCTLCPQSCGLDRTAGRGFCEVGTAAAFDREGIYYAEESPLLPAWEIFFAGCNLRCRFCYQQAANLHPAKRRAIDGRKLADLFRLAGEHGARSINLIGGEPTLFLPVILDALRQEPAPLPVVVNSNLYFNREVCATVETIADLVIGDIHFGPGDCSREIAGAPRYWNTVTNNLIALADHTPLLIRHLLLPGHLDCCLTPILAWIEQHLADTPFNLLRNYLPPFGGTAAPLNRRLSFSEHAAADRILRRHKLNLWHDPPPGSAPLPAPSPMGIEEIRIEPDGTITILGLTAQLLPLLPPPSP